MERVAGSAAALLTMALACGCGSDLIEVKVEEQTTVEGASLPDQLLGDLGFPGFDSFDISQSQTFRNQGYTEDDVDAMFTRSFDMRVLAPSDATFDFLNSIRFTVQAEGLPDVDIAWLDPIPEGESELRLEVDANADLQPYVVAPEMTIETFANGRRPPEETTIEARIVFDVDVNVL